MQCILETNNLTKEYNGKVVVSNVNMHIYEGDIYGFVGENGAGKTTILRLISGLIFPSGGDFKLFGASNNESDIYAARSKISGIIESVSLNKGMKALDNLRLQCVSLGLKRSDEELIELINHVGLRYDEIKDKKVGNFSLGMRQRLGIAIAIVSKPKFILLDEPMNGLDPQGFVDVRETIMKLNKEGVTFLISSHILSELDKICNRIGFISHGKLIEEITMKELHDKARRKIRIVSSDGEDTLKLLVDKLKLKNTELEGNNIDIFDEVDINDVMNVLVSNKRKVISINVVDETIEDYYVNLVTRGN